MKYHKLCVNAIDKLTENAVAVKFEVPTKLTQNFKFIAGQYVSLKSDFLGHSVRRSYSICVSPDENELQIGVKRLMGGVFSEYVNTTLKVGDYLHVSEPEGKFIFDKKTSEMSVVAFAAGSGITPIMSIVKTFLNSYKKSKFYLYYGNRSEKETIFFSQIKELEEKHKNFYVTYFYNEIPESSEQYGLIDEHVVKQALEIKQIQRYYICGPGEMIMNVKNTLKNKNVKDKNIFFELFSSSNLNKIKESGVTEIKSEKTQVELVLDGKKNTFEMFKNELVLDIAIKNKIDAPYSCQGGVCASCIVKVEEGKVEMKNNHVLTDEEIAEGLTLCCQSLPKSDFLRLNFDDI